MAYTSADYEKAWSAQTTVELRQESIWLNLTSQTHTRPWVNGMQTVYIPKPDWATNTSPTPDEGVTAHSRARKGDWAAAQAGDQDLVTFTRSGGFSTSNVIAWEDAIELPWPVVEATRRRQTYIMTKAIDEAIHDVVDSASGSATSLGSNANSINRSTGVPANDTARGYVRQALEMFALEMELANANSPASDSVGSRYAVMSPYLFKVLMDDMLESKYSWDILTSEILRENRILASRGYRGRLFGIDIFSWSHLGLPGAGNDWPILCGAREGVNADIRPPLVQYFTPATNQVSSAPGHLLRQAGDYGAVSNGVGLIKQYDIDGGA